MFGIIYHLYYPSCRPTVCVTCVWAGVDSAWEQEKLEARKMLLNRAESYTSGARFVRPHGWQKKPTDEKNAFGAEALNTAGKIPLPKYLPIL